jgi:hypothetical protein
MGELGKPGPLKAVVGFVSMAVLVLGLLNSVAFAAPKKTTSAKISTTVLQPGTIVGHRFVKSFNLSHGALILTPFRGVAPALSAALQTTMWAS